MHYIYCAQYANVLYAYNTQMTQGAKLRQTNTYTPGSMQPACKVYLMGTQFIIRGKRKTVNIDNNEKKKKYNKIKQIYNKNKK